MRTKRGLEVRAQMQDYGRNIGILVSNVDGSGQFQVARELVFEPADAEGMLFPTFSLRREQAQQLMDELWRCGVRPTEGSGSAGSLAATQEHLKDMRTIAFSLLDGEQVLARVARETGAKR